METGLCTLVGYHWADAGTPCWDMDRLAMFGYRCTHLCMAVLLGCALGLFGRRFNFQRAWHQPSLIVSAALLSITGLGAMAYSTVNGYSMQCTQLSQSNCRFMSMGSMWGLSTLLALSIVDCRRVSSFVRVISRLSAAATILNLTLAWVLVRFSDHEFVPNSLPIAAHLFRTSLVLRWSCLFNAVLCLYMATATRAAWVSLVCCVCAGTTFSAKTVHPATFRSVVVQ